MSLFSRRSCRSIIAWCVFAAVWAIGSRPAIASTFQDASAAFASGDYARAFDLFETVRAEGGDEPALHYNIAVCQYKLGRYADAAAAFSDLARRFPKLGSLAEYNRALSLTALGRDRAARAALDVARVGADPTVRRLADELLASLTAKESEVSSLPRWEGLVDFAAGHDDNVALIDALSLPAGQSAGSSFREAVAVASRSLGSTVPFRLDLSGYFVRYPETSEYDQNWVRVAGEFSWRAGGWRIAAGPRVSTSTLGGVGLERQIGAAFRAVHDLGSRARFEARVGYDALAALDSQFDYVSGLRRQAHVAVDFAAVGGHLRVAFESEVNDRDAAIVASDRWRALLGYRRQLGGRWSIDGDLVYRVSRYPELSVPREEDLTALDVAARRRLGHGWSFDIDYRHSGNDSSAPGYAYSAARVGIGVSKDF